MPVWDTGIRRLPQLSLRSGKNCFSRTLAWFKKKKKKSGKKHCTAGVFLGKSWPTPRSQPNISRDSYWDDITERRSSAITLVRLRSIPGAMLKEGLGLLNWVANAGTRTIQAGVGTAARPCDHESYMRALHLQEVCFDNLSWKAYTARNLLTVSIWCFFVLTPFLKS